jgi:hypothetical protein
MTGDKMTGPMSEVGRQVALSLLQWTDFPITEDFIKAASNVALSSQELRQYQRRIILAELAKLQGNANGSAGTIASG